jgi:ribosomal protein S18 acetylase RimI-like enzyme
MATIPRPTRAARAANLPSGGGDQLPGTVRYGAEPASRVAPGGAFLDHGQVPAPEITFELLDGTQAAQHADELQALAAEVYADPPYRQGAGQARDFAHRFGVQRRQPGFALAQARHGEYLVGYALGMPLRPSTSWWRNLTAPVPAEVTAEHPGRTFALAELLVRAPWRRQGIGRDLHDLILAGRPEERATLTVRPAAAPAQGAFQSWGWRKVARAQDPEPGAPVLDVLLRPLPGGQR